MAVPLEKFKPLSVTETVGMSGVVADAQRPMLRMDTRYDYMTHHLPEFKGMIRFRAYSIACLLAGIWLLFQVPLLGVVAMFLAMYYWQMHDLMYRRSLGNTRTVMIGH
jgi:hypothetical protein